VVLLFVGCGASHVTVPIRPVPAPEAAAPQSQPSGPPSEALVGLTWVLSTPTPDPARPESDEYATRHVALIVRTGAESRRIDLGSQAGVVVPSNQSICGKFEPPGEGPLELGRAAFDLVGSTGYVVREETSHSIVVVHFAQDDGACPGPTGEVEACPPDEKVIERLQVPKHASFEEAMVVVSASGEETPFVCRSAASALPTPATAS
jgi:hypothetical protein